MSGMPQSIDSGEWTWSSCTERRNAAVDKPRKLEVRRSARRSETSRGIDDAELGLNLTRQEYPLGLTVINTHQICRVALRDTHKAEAAWQKHL
jgi:hypothetical protein